MSDIYILNGLDSRRVSPEGFATRQAAKILRNKLLAEGTKCVVSRGPGHPQGVSKVDSRCQNKERTSRKRRRIEQPE